MQCDGEPLLVRVDASTRIGSGHLMRCLALAQRWQAQGEQAVFITACESESLRRRLSGEGFRVIALDRPYPDLSDWEITSQALAGHPGAWVVLDGYHFDSAYQHRIKQADHPLLVVDDMAHLNHYYADVVLNQNIYAEELQYSCEPYSRLLLGTRYALLRAEFLAWRGWQREIPEVARKILVTLGGSDPHNQTLKTIRALQQVGVADLEAVIVVGGSNPHYTLLQSAVRTSQIPIHLQRNVTNMPELMAWADVAVSAGGSTCWELAFMGLPSLVLVLAENQHAIAQGLEKAEISLNLGWHEGVSFADIAEMLEGLLTNRHARAQMSQRGRQLVDDEGGNRVVAEMLAEVWLRARSASMQDIELLFRWANDPLTRRMSFNSSQIAWEDHQRWFKEIINRSDASLMIVELREQDGWTPIGQVRIDEKGVVSISISPSYRGRGLAEPALRKAIASYDICFRRKILTAYIKPENEISQKVFTRVGFEFAEGSNVSGHTCWKYILPLPDDRNSDSPDRGDRYVQNS